MKKKKEFKNWWIIGLLIPFIGLIFYYSNYKMSKETKSNLLTSTIIGFGIWLFVALSFLISVNGPAKVEPKEYSVGEWLVETKKEEPVVTVIGLTTCGHCQSYKPVIEKMAEEYGFKLFFFETDELDSSDATLIETEYELKEFEDLVPFTYIVKKGEVIAENTGYPGEAAIKEFLRTAGVIN